METRRRTNGRITQSCAIKNGDATIPISDEILERLAKRQAKKRRKPMLPETPKDIHERDTKPIPEYDDDTVPIDSEILDCLAAIDRIQHSIKTAAQGGLISTTIFMVGDIIDKSEFERWKKK
jgi:hypothetical protein